MQNPRFGSKLKFQKKCSNLFYKSLTLVLCEKQLQKTNNIREMRAFGSKIEIQKNMSKAILQIIYTCSLQKTAPKNTKYSRNESILKIGHHACKGSSPCKILTLAQRLKFQKTCQNPFYKSFTVVLCKKTAS